MYLEKLEIQGFKSFANKNVLTFPGVIDKTRRGLTAIVGPNGSGKSNIADAVRWVMGEQSMKTLRGKKAEDIVFGGSEKHGKLGMAEVSLHLNNEDPEHGGVGAKAPIDYSQIVITRRVYRDGASEYSLNNNRVRLSDIEMLLAKSNFGQKTYSVIGQGMVEGFLNTSLAERKEFFDEATGVKQFQIKRDESLNKLKLSLENLGQAQMLLNEIEPRLKSLTRQVNKLQKKGVIEEELREMQLAYYRKVWHETKDKFSESNKKYLELEKIKMEKDKKLGALKKELDQMETQNGASAEFDDWQIKLAELQERKDSFVKELARIDAQMEIKLEMNGQFDLSWLNGKKSELSRELGLVCEEISSLEKSTSESINEYKKLNEENRELNSKINELNEGMIKNNGSLSSEEAKKISDNVKGLFLKLNAAEEENDIIKIKEAVAEIKEELEKIIVIVGKGRNDSDLEKIQRELTELSEKREATAARINENNIKNSSLIERRKLIAEKRVKLEQDLEKIEKKLVYYLDQAELSDINESQEKVRQSAAEVDVLIAEIKNKINGYSEKEREQKIRIFDLQKKMSAFQNEINSLSDSLNELKVNSARHETRLEDMEKEIRSELGGLKEIEKQKEEGFIDLEATMLKISSLKKQLDMIGSLDPEIEKEYIETKERYDFISGQVNDLTSTINSLEKVIKELDMVIKERFDKEFKLIQEKFGEYFKILFSGGQARIVKVTTDELLNEEEKEIEGKDVGEIIKGDATQTKEAPTSSQMPTDGKENLFTAEVYKKIKLLQKYNATGLAGVEIQATPPGKKIKTLSLLSGGERALTAIALICAIISANPAPFVVLDEVDASLDEANSERLAKILDELSVKTQFIVITHNRASMRRANVLYGVTMQDDGMSKLLSVKLDEVKARNEY